MIQDIWPRLQHRQESKQERKRCRIIVVVSSIFHNSSQYSTLCTTSEIDGAAASLAAPFMQALSPVCVCECVCALSAL